MKTADAGTKWCPKAMVAFVNDKGYVTLQQVAYNRLTNQKMEVEIPPAACCIGDRCGVWFDTTPAGNPDIPAPEATGQCGLINSTT